MITCVPKEVISIIRKKKQIIEDEQLQMKMKVFSDFVIPWIFNFRNMYTKVFGDEEDPDECVKEIGNLTSNLISSEFISSFLLTAIKRVCKHLKQEVDLGRGIISEYSPDRFYQNKDDPF